MHKQIAALVVLVLLLAVVLIFSGVTFKPASAANNHNITGWAWSSNVGWIAFNCNSKGTGQDVDSNGTCEVNPDYGVDVDTTLTPSPVTGYAWANIGWISFNSASLVGCPDSKCSAQLDATASGVRKMSGWARACAVFVSGCSGALKADNSLGGWTGFISLSPKAGDTVIFDPTANCRVAPGSVPNGCYGVRMDVAGTNANKFSGFAWGGDVLGWINFSPVAVDGSVIAGPVSLQEGAVAATLTATPVKNGITTLDWGSSGTEGSAPCTLASTPVNSGWNIGGVVASGSKDITPTGRTTFTVTCNGSSGTTANASVVVDPPVISALNVTPADAAPNSDVTLDWAAAGGTAPLICTRSNAWTGTSGPSGSTGATVGSDDTTFTLQCADKNAQTSLPVSAVVSVASGTFNLNINPATVPVSFVSDKPETTSSKTLVTVNGVTGFIKPIALSVPTNSVVCANGSVGTVAAHFGNRTTGAATAQISSPYSGSQDLYISFSCDVGAGPRTVTLRGVAGGKTVNTVLTINVQSFKPVFQER